MVLHTDLKVRRLQSRHHHTQRPPAHRAALTSVQAGHQLVDDVLQGGVWPDAQQRLGLVHLDVADGTESGRLQVRHDALAADWRPARQNVRTSERPATRYITMYSYITLQVTSRCIVTSHYTLRHDVQLHHITRYVTMYSYITLHVTSRCTVTSHYTLRHDVKLPITLHVTSRCTVTSHYTLHHDVKLPITLHVTSMCAVKRRYKLPRYKHRTSVGLPNEQN